MPSAISTKLHFIEIALRHGCFPVNLMHIFRTSFPKNTSGWLLVKFDKRLIDSIITCVIGRKRLSL